MVFLLLFIVGTGGNRGESGFCVWGKRNGCGEGKRSRDGAKNGKETKNPLVFLFFPRDGDGDGDTGDDVTLHWALTDRL